MKKIAIVCMALLAGALSPKADDGVIVLDLSNATTQLTFDAETGAWNGTYNDDEESIESQCFSFVHSSMGDYDTWWGFTASNSADNRQPENTLKFQFSNMAKGGIVLNDDGSVKIDEFGAPVVSADVPYLVAFYNAYFAKRPVDVAFSSGKSYDVVGAYFNLNSYAYYSIEFGDGFARAFTNGDKFTLTIHGVTAEGTEKTVEVDLASCANGNLTTARGWSYVDLSALEGVNELYFTLDSTDSGDYGMNTPGYFCMDKLMVKESAKNGMGALGSDYGVKLAYDRSTRMVSLGKGDFAVVYDAMGHKVMTGESAEFSVAQLPAGVYVVKCRNEVLKFAK